MESVPPVPLPLSPQLGSVNIHHPTTDPAITVFCLFPCYRSWANVTSDPLLVTVSSCQVHTRQHPFTPCLLFIHLFHICAHLTKLYVAAHIYSLWLGNGLLSVKPFLVLCKAQPWLRQHEGVGGWLSC